MKDFLEKVEYYIQKYGMQVFERYGWVAGIVACIVIVAIVGGALWYFGG